MDMTEVKHFANKHTHALSKLGYRYLLVAPDGQLCESTIDKYLIEQQDGTVVGNIEPPVQVVQESNRRQIRRKRRPIIRFNQQTGYIAKLKAMKPGDLEPLQPPVNTTAANMQHAVHSAALRVFGKGTFETSIFEGKVLVFYKGSAPGAGV